ncbi:hypothetical protein [Chitinivibrio alkaliphilus]|nr:hypothetical protein [Chitinivibrio alkaliphilus]
MLKHHHIVMILLLPLLLSAETSDRHYWEGISLFEIGGSLPVESYTAHSPAVDIYGQIPLHMSSNRYIASGILYRRDILLNESRLHSAQVGQVIAVVNQGLRNNLHLYSEYNGGINSLWDSPQKGQSHFILSFLGQHRGDTYLRLGAAFLYEFEEGALFPVVGVSHAFSPTIRAELLVPRHIILKKSLSPLWEGGIKSSYHRQKNSFSGTQITTQEYFKNGVYTDRILVQDLLIRAKGGVLLFVDKETDGVPLDQDQRFFFRLSLRWRV